MDEKMIVASDLNGTLTTGAPALAVTEWIKTNQPDVYPWLYKYRLYLSYLQVRFGWVAIDSWADKVLREVISLIRSPDQKLLNTIMEFVVDTELWPKRRENVVSFLQDYHNQGAEIYVISAAYEPAVDIFARRIGKDRIKGIGTQVIITENGFALEDNLITRAHKLRRVNDIIGTKQIDVALGDTTTDLPLLERSKHPIAVFPDQELRSVAEKKGWQIME
jgi:phosphoserine phosphatase